MTNARQIEQVFGPLAAQHDDLKQIGSPFSGFVRAATWPCAS
jgi:hypothetical protein